MGEKRLSDSAAEEILAMITVEKRFLPGDKLPNENDSHRRWRSAGRHFGKRSGPWSPMVFWRFKGAGGHL